MGRRREGQKAGRRKEEQKEGKAGSKIEDTAHLVP